MKNAITWFEIPVSNFERAKKFYEILIGYELLPMDFPGMKMAGFRCDYENDGVGGAIVLNEAYKPCESGCVLYLNGGDDLSIYLNRVESAGGKIIMPKTHISEQVGYMAFFQDSEGNSIAFQSRN